MKMIVAFLFIIAIASSAKLVFQDNFTNFDFTKWRHDITLSGGGNWSTTFVQNSTLNIKPVLTQDKIGAQNVRAGFQYSLWGGSPADQCTGNQFYGCERTSNGNNYINPIMSGKVTTVNSFSLLYGRVQVKAKLPKGDWLWPAIWMLPKYNQYGQWPASGEIDIMESRGNVNYPKEFGGGPETFASTLHWGPDYSTNQFSKTHAEKSVQGSLADDFHTYGLYWDDKKIYTYLDTDDNKVLQVDHSQQSYWQKSGLSGRDNPWRTSPNKNAPFDRPFYLIINLAVGGTNGYFKDGVAAKPWSDQSSRASSEFYDNKGQWQPTWGQHSTFQIRSVKIWDNSDNIEEE